MIAVAGARLLSVTLSGLHGAPLPWRSEGLIMRNGQTKPHAGLCVSQRGIAPKCLAGASISCAGATWFVTGSPQRGAETRPALHASQGSSNPVRCHPFAEVWQKGC